MNQNERREFIEQAICATDEVIHAVEHIQQKSSDEADRDHVENVVVCLEEMRTSGTELDAELGSYYVVALDIAGKVAIGAPKGDLVQVHELLRKARARLTALV